MLDSLPPRTRSPKLQGDSVSVPLDRFSGPMLREEAARQGISTEHLIVHAIVYYLADLSRGRTACTALRIP